MIAIITEEKGVELTTIQPAQQQDGGSGIVVFP